jgi:DNA-binding beta-propeller fold protein YncE
LIFLNFWILQNSKIPSGIFSNLNTNKKITMKNWILVILFVFISASNLLFAQSNAELDAKRVLLPNGWSITPIGKNINLADLPLNMVISNNKKLMAVTNNGQSTHCIHLIDIAKAQVVDSMFIPKAWYGIAFSSNDQSLYVSGGHDNRVNKYAINDSKMKLVDSFLLGKPWPFAIGTAGLDVDEIVNKKLFVVTKEAKSLYVFDLSTKQLISQLKLGAEAYACKLSLDKKLLYISLWGDKKVLIYDIESAKITAEVAVGDHPNELLLNKKGDYLFVANSQDNSVSVINTKNNKVIDLLDADVSLAFEITEVMNCKLYDFYRNYIAQK